MLTYHFVKLLVNVLGGKILLWGAILHVVYNICSVNYQKIGK